jgi:2',3'-cyclic-nucleotide 2'-phosphodiesterase/3'-nucleotidase
MTVTRAIHADAADRAGRTDMLRLRLLATSDLHAHLFPFNYYTDRRDESVGLAALADLVEQARADCPNTLLFDNGDTIQGAPLGDAALSDLMPGNAVHPMIAAMNALGYDAATVGNHDFDFGLDALRSALSATRYPVVLANAVTLPQRVPLLPPHVILERSLSDIGGRSHTLRIGVTGVAPPQINQWCHARLAGRLEVGPMVPAAAEAARRLRAAGADVVIVLAHTGLGHADAAPDAENTGHAIARLPGVDAVVAGHTHRVFPPETDRKPPPGTAALVQPGCHGSHLGQIDLVLRPASGGPGPWEVASAEARVLPAAEAPGRAMPRPRRRSHRLPEFRAQLARGHRLTRSYAARVVGRSAVPLETYFSLCAPCAATQLIAEAQRAAVAPQIAADPALACLPLLSCTTPFKAGGRGGPEFYTDIAPGALMLRQIADLYAYTNGLSLLRATGAQLRAWLERSASAFHRIDPGAPGPQPLIDHGFASYNFDRFDGLLHEIDVSQPACTNAEGDVVIDGPGRIRNLRRADGMMVGDDDLFLVVTNAYRAAGGGHHPAAASCEVVFETAAPVRDRLVDYIAQSRGPIAPVAGPGWSFTPLGGTPVLYQTGPGARSHRRRARELGLSYQGIDPSGFASYLLAI